MRSYGEDRPMETSAKEITLKDIYDNAKDNFNLADEISRRLEILVDKLIFGAPSNKSTDTVDTKESYPSGSIAIIFAEGGNINAKMLKSLNFLNMLEAVLTPYPSSEKENDRR